MKIPGADRESVPVGDPSDRPGDTLSSPPTAGPSSSVPVAPAGVARRLILTAIGVAPVAAILAVLGSRLGRGSGRSAIGVNAETQQAPLRPRPAPDFRLTTFDGDEFRLSEHRGEVIVLNFWASWCGPCRLEAPHLEAAHGRLESEGLTMLGIDIWDDEPDARAFIDEFNVTYANAPDPTGKIAIDFGVTGIPETFMVDRKGVVVQHWIGPLTEDRLVSSVRSLLDEPAP